MYREKIADKLRKMIDINIPIIYINDYDTIRVNSIIFEATQGCEVKEWNPGTYLLTKFGSFAQEGIDHKSTKNILDDLNLELYLRVNRKYETPFVFVLRDVQDFIDKPSVKSLLASIAQRKLYDSRYELTIIIVSSVVKVPEELMPYVSFLDIDYPDDEEIRNIIYRHLYVNDKNANGDYDENNDLDDKSESEIIEFVKGYVMVHCKESLSHVEKLLPSFRGMPPFDIDRMVDMAMSQNGTLRDDDKQMILEHKKQVVKKSGILEFIDSDVKIDDIGGLEILKTYLRSKAVVRKYSKEAEEEGISMPKGIFLVGMPGCGKSLSAQATSSIFGEPLLRLDMGTLMGSKVGESESNLRKAIRIAEAAAPCVLWIDEIEKGFSGTTKDDNAYLRRMLGFFLSWLQDKKTAVFVVATANNIDNIPTEFLRKGRFDEIFFIDFPNKKECKAIIELKVDKILKRKLKIEKEFKITYPFKVDDNCDLVKLVSGKKDSHKNFCGADIEYIVNKAFEMMFRRQKAIEEIKRIKDDISKIELDPQHEAQMFEEKTKELKMWEKAFNHELSTESQDIYNYDYQEDEIVVPDIIKCDSNLLANFLYRIAEKTTCLSMTMDDKTLEKMKNKSPKVMGERSPYLPASKND